jgi:hypothetical protein
MSWLVRTAGAAQAFMYRRGVARKMGKMQQVLLTTTGRKRTASHGPAGRSS